VSAPATPGGAHSVDVVEFIRQRADAQRVAQGLAARKRVVVSGASGSSTHLLAGAVSRELERPVILVLAHLDDADEAADELNGAGVSAFRVPALEGASAESVAIDLWAARVRLARLLPGVAGASVIVAPIQALMQGVPSPRQLANVSRIIRVGETHNLTKFTRWLADAGYRRADSIEEPGDFSVRGGIVDVFPPAPAEIEVWSGDPVPVRLDFFGDEVERISEVDLSSMGADRALKGVEIISPTLTMASGRDRAGGDNRQGLTADDAVNLLELCPAGAAVMLAETMEIVEQGRGYYERVIDSRGVWGPPAVLKLLEQRFHALAEVNQFSRGASASDARIEFGVANLASFPRDAGEAVHELLGIAKGPPRRDVTVCCQNDGERSRMGELLGPHAGAGGAEHVRVGVAYLHRGFVLEPGADGGAGVALVPYHELLSRFSVRRGARAARGGRAMDTFLDFDEGDYVVHADHGVARFIGLVLMRPRELPRAQRVSLPGETKREEKKQEDQEEYLALEFAGGAKLYVPATRIDAVQKYVGGFSGKPQLSVLGGQRWQAQKERVAEGVRDLAGELLRVRAAREHLPGISYPHDTAWQNEFEAEFPYEETPDQLAALQEIKRDMHAARPMDRLLCGDVGFGKTELAIRAAFKAAEFGKQVAVLVPTTVLAEQHERTFRARFAGYPFRVESVSRFKTDGEVRAVLREAAQGRVDVLIGTHRLLSQDVHFKDLGLVVVDEEQRFGVEHKEALLRLRLTADVLTMSATPIPRTLHMAMLGIRDISSLTTAPADRRAIVTEVIPYNPARVQQAIARELAREGQVYYVHNRVHDIRSVADDVRRLAPDARIVVGHGQMTPHELEEVMLAFIRREADILVATTIIESGIDIPTANTMIIDDADRFGLSDLHQLRGRVGRSKHRGYCYLLTPVDRTLKENAIKRLRALEQYSMLGAGFKIALRDLEIRGAGNILGPEQSGHIAAVGYEMYCRLLEDAVHDLKHEKRPAPPSATAVEVGVSGLIPKAYVPSAKRRLALYRRLATAATAEDLAKARSDMVEAYGEPPAPVERLYEIAELRLALAARGVRSVTIREKDVIFFCADAERLAEEMRSRATTAAARAATVTPLPPEDKGGLPMLYFRPPESALEPATLLRVLRARFGVGERNPKAVV